MTSARSAAAAPPRTRAIVAALRLLAARRLTEAQLWSRLERRGYSDEDVRAAVTTCKRDGYLDDRLFARLYVDGRDKAVGDARLVAELVRRGIDRESARDAVERAERSQDERLERAMRRVMRVRPRAGYPAVARTLERLGFPASAIYRRLRAEALASDDVAHAFANGEESFEPSA